MNIFGLNCEGARGRDNWRVGIKGATSELMYPSLNEKWLLKLLSC